MAVELPPPQSERQPNEEQPNEEQPNEKQSLRVLALEPFYGGSHRQFLDEWCQRSAHRWTVLGLPARKWKWRMRLGAVELARRIREVDRDWDVLLCSDMLSLAELKGLVPTLTRVPAVLYFHENQLTYPVRVEQERDLHFAITNLVSAFAADAVWFNSAFHRDDFLAALPKLVAKMPDARPRAEIAQLRQRCEVQWPGVEDPGVDPRSRDPEAPLHIVWAARWEFDKGPETLFRALGRLPSEMRWQISVLGESYREVPPVFAAARERFGDRILHWGFLEDRERYHQVLRRADVFVSTAQHEFFGLSAVEAMLAGAFPLLPRRLSYPELVGPEGERDFLYDGAAGVLARRLEELAAVEREGLGWAGVARRQALRFRWSERAPLLDAALRRVVADHSLER